jgi:hypothetical protein
MQNSLPSGSAIVIQPLPSPRGGVAKMAVTRFNESFHPDLGGVIRWG